MPIKFLLAGLFANILYSNQNIKNEYVLERHQKIIHSIANQHLIQYSIRNNNCSGMPNEPGFNSTNCQLTDVQFIEEMVSNSLEYGIDFSVHDINGNSEIEPLELGTQVWENGRLIYFECIDCELMGNIPNSIGNARELRELFLFNNDLGGNIPPTIGEPEELEILDLGWNNLSGLIPSQIYSLSNLEFLNLNYNTLIGEFSEDIGNLTSLIYLNVSGNSGLYGELPATVSNLTQLETFKLSFNSFRGYIPDSVCELNINNWGASEDFFESSVENNAFCEPFPTCIPYDQLSDDVQNCTMGCMEPAADNYDPTATNPLDCFYVYNLPYGNTLGSFPGLPNPSTASNLLETGYNIQFIIGNGTGLFLQDDGFWSGNLNTVDQTSGYWINTAATQSWNMNLPDGLSDPCLQYDLSIGNNLISYVGEDELNFNAAFGYFKECFNFVVGQGVGQFNYGNGNWSGNLNNMNNWKGYYVNVSSSCPYYDNGSFTFWWGSGYECQSPVTSSGYIPELDPQTVNYVNTNKNIHPFSSEYRFTQSTEQAFYLVKDIPEVEKGDLILVYCNDNLVGSVEWSGEYTPVPVMGRDISPQTEGFCEAGDIPQFKLLTSHNSQLLSLVSKDVTTPGWSSLGVYTLESLTTQTVEIPSEFVLHPAYPNPFNPVTTITFGIPSPSPVEERAGVRSENRDVSLTIYDITGKQVKTLLNKPMALGHHSIQWNAAGQPSGVYFVKLNADKFESSQKILLVK